MMFWHLFLFLSFAGPQKPTFQEETIDDQVKIGYGLAIGDVDGDGKPDILMADKNEFVWYRNGDWKRFVMVKNLTEHDNVCIAAKDINGDGKVEVAVGAQWNPSETSDDQNSGSVHYLIRPDDPTQSWEAVPMHHEPTVHRMRWAKIGPDQYHLIMLPLHGRGNKGGEGDGVRVIAYEMQDKVGRDWKHWVIDQSMHITHNLELVNKGNADDLYIGGKEGVKAFSFNNGKWDIHPDGAWLVDDNGFGEIRIGKTKNGKNFLTGVEPFHGPILTTYMQFGKVFSKSNLKRELLTDNMKQGHGLAAADLLEIGEDQIIVGWREPNTSGELGIKLFVPDAIGGWEANWIDKNGMACEDLKVADLNGDGKLDIIASGRATNNLKIYWNQSK